MDWTRRRFVTSVASGTAGLSLGARSRASDAVQDRFGEFPLAGLVRQFRQDQARRGGVPSPTGLARDEYLRVTGGIIRFFAAHQDARGVIMDPYGGRKATDARSPGRRRALLGGATRLPPLSGHGVPARASRRGRPTATRTYTVLLCTSIGARPLVQSPSRAWRRDRPDRA
jgi:hypothetical protein